MAKARSRRDDSTGPVALEREDALSPVEQNQTQAVMPEDVGETAAADTDRERVAHRAYELYMARGGTHGQDLEDWLAAERELAESRRRDER